MRTFALIDKDGTTYNITVKDKAFFYGVTGLGFEEETAFLRIKERFSLASKKLAQGKIVGTVKFWQSGAEAEYFQFAQFCQNGPLKLRYAPQSGHKSKSGFSHGYVENRTLFLPYEYVTLENFYRDGYVTRIEKSDGVGNCLEVVIEFTAETPWYKKVSEYNYGGQSQDGKKYSYEYSYQYATTADNEITIVSDSWQQSPAKIIIQGPVTDPIWRQYLDDELVATGKLNGSILAGHRLVIDTTTIPYSIKEFDSAGNFVADLYQSCDFSTERFIRLAHGKNRITVSGLNANAIGVGVEAQLEYATV